MEEQRCWSPVLDALMLPMLYPHQLLHWVDSVLVDLPEKLSAVSFLSCRVGCSLSTGVCVMAVSGPSPVFPDLDAWNSLFPAVC